MEKPKRKRRILVFQEKTLLLSLLLLLLITAGLICAYLGCNRIAVNRSSKQMEDAVANVSDQIRSKFQRDSEILNSLANILAKSNSFAEDGSINREELQQTISVIDPLLTTMRLRILPAKGDLIMPDGSTRKEVDLSFDELVSQGEHISHRLTSLVSGEPIIAHYVPVIRDGAPLAVIYGVTSLSSLPSALRVGNIYNSTADVAIIDVISKDMILDTLNPTLGSSTEFSTWKSKGKKSLQEIREDMYSLNEGTATVWSKVKNEWLYVSYGRAWPKDSTFAAKDQWCIFVTVPESLAFGNVKQVRTVFIIVGSVVGVAVILYFLYIRRDAKKSIQKTVERAVLEERLHKAEAAERAKTTFLSNMSHDIRTPMNAILGFTTLAEANIDSKERVQDYLKKILSSGNHLLSLINDILDMSRIESGKLNIEEKPCSISDIFRDMRNIIQTQMKSKQLNFFMDTLDVIDEEIYCDKLHVNQVLLNLLSNAIKFTPAGGSVSLLIRQKPGAPTGYGSYEIRVKDTGIGMSAEFAKHIFEPFERERTSTVSGIQGTGLGMAITKNIVDTMGGTIDLVTEPGKGTEFIIDLQFKLQSERKQIEVIRELEGMRALVVDDSFSTCDSVSKMLLQIGMRSEWTLYGKEAVLRTQQAVDMGDPFSAYIIDWVMPDLGGFEIVRQIRKIVGEETPIIIVTAYDLSAILDEAKDAGVTAYCNKPIFLSELRDTLISVIEKKESKQENLQRKTHENLKGKKLLLVEDNELNREIAEELLEENGFEVDTAEDGTIAVDKVKNSSPGRYDLILMDILMPTMNGYEATKAIRSLEDKQKAEIPIVAMTANAFDEDRKKAAECGMNAHIPKPIDLNLLLDVLENILGKEEKKPDKNGKISRNS